MSAVQVEIELKDIDAYVKRKNRGIPRPLTPVEVETLFYWANLLLVYIKNQWPIDTGTSRDRWSVVADTSPGRMSLIVENPMYYASFVHRAGTPATPELWSVLVPQAWSLFKLPLNQAVYKAVDRTTRIAEEQATTDASYLERIFEQFRNPDRSGMPDILTGGGGG